MLSGLAAAGAMLVSGAKYQTVNNNVLDAQIGPATNWQMRDGVVGQVYAPADNADNQEVYFERYRAFFGKAKKYALNVPGGNARENQWLQLWSNYDGDKNFDFLRTDDGHIKHMPGGRDSGLCVAVGANNILVLQQCCDRQEQIFRPVGSTPNTQNAVSTGSGTGWVKQLFPTKRLLSWAENDMQFNKLNVGSKIAGLMHWEHGDVKGNNKIWLPQFWGDRKWAEWNARKAEIKASGKVPPVVLSFNECDLAIGQNSQASAGMDPYWAAQLHKKEIEDVFRPMGSKIIGPQWGSIWNEDYINKFMGECQKLGCKFDGIGLHHYESMKDGVDAAVRNTIAQVEKAYERFKMPIFLTELGFSSAGGGTDQQFIEYLQKIGRYLDNTDKVAVWALSAVQRKGGNGWGNDGGFMSSSFCFFNADYSVTELGYKYMYDTF
jgi:hypothetical protein